MNAAAIRDENVFDAPVNAVIIYDEFDFAANANAMLEYAAHRTDEPMHWSVKPWRVDMLELPPAAEVALAEAADAHLIVLAVREFQSHLPWLMDWLERWATGRRILEAALAVWVGGFADTRLAEVTHELSQFAGHHGLSLIFNDNTLFEGKSSMVTSDLQKHEVSLTLMLQHIPEPPERGQNQNRGEND
jgi:hypothetical protein